MKNTIAVIGVLFLVLIPAQITLAEEDCDGVDELRIYSGHIARWLGIDPLADKYPDVSPYVYCEDNPLMYVDPDGNQIFCMSLYYLDKKATEDIIADLNMITGLQISYNNGILDYEKDKDGNAIIDSENMHSATAREILINAIDNPSCVNVFSTKVGKIDRCGYYKDKISISSNQINAFIEGTTGLDSRTLGYGMTFLHELLHSPVGGGYKDQEDEVTTVSIMNKIRSELGESFGQRTQYEASKINGGESVKIFFDDSKNEKGELVERYIIVDREYVK